MASNADLAPVFKRAAELFFERSVLECSGCCSAIARAALDYRRSDRAWRMLDSIFYEDAKSAHKKTGGHAQPLSLFWMGPLFGPHAQAARSRRVYALLILAQIAKEE